MPCFEYFASGVGIISEINIRYFVSNWFGVCVFGRVSEVFWTHPFNQHITVPPRRIILHAGDALCVINVSQYVQISF